MSAPAPRDEIFVAGVGNIFCGDDGFGVEVARRMAGRALPEGMRVADYGIRSLHLAYELADRAHATAILVDAMPRGGPPGTLYVVEPDPAAVEPAAPADGHTISPDAVLALLRALGAVPRRLLVVGCEPQRLDEGIGLSPPVAAAVDEAIALILSLARPPAGPGGA